MVGQDLRAAGLEQKICRDIFWLNIVRYTWCVTARPLGSRKQIAHSAVCHKKKKNLKHINLPRGVKHKAFRSFPRRGHQYFTALAQPLGEHASLADCVLIEKERATLIVWGHSFEVGLLLFKCLSSACLSSSASEAAAASQMRAETPS